MANARKSKNANGEGTIFKRARDGKWVAELVIGWTPEGKKQVIRSTGDTRAEVKAWLTSRLAEKQTGTLATPTKDTVGEFVARWIEKTAPLEVGPSTLRLYSNMNEWYIAPHLGAVALSQLRPQHIQDMFHAMLTAGKSPRTVQLARTVLRRALQQAVEWSQLARNPVDLVKSPRQEHREMQVLEPEQLGAFLEAAKGDRLHALFTLAVTTGLRNGELIALRWQDIDLAAGTLTVAQTMKVVQVKDSDGRKHEKRIFGQTKTKASRRTLSLPGVATAALRKWKAEQAQERLILGAAWSCPDLVFTTQIGTPIDPKRLRNRSFSRILRAANLPKIRFHDLRHSFATFLALQGVSDTVMQKVLGHSTITITKQLYVHVLERQKAEAAQKVDDFFAPTRTKAK